MRPVPWGVTEVSAENPKAERTWFMCDFIISNQKIGANLFNISGLAVCKRLREKRRVTFKRDRGSGKWALSLGMDDQLAVDHHIAEGLRLVGGTVAVGLAEQFHQYLGGLGPLAVGILFDGGHRRSLKVGCDRQVGIADETDVFVDPEL